MNNDLARRCNLIEECYEYLLAYAAMGVAGDEGEGKAGQVRHFLDRASGALDGIADAYAAATENQPAEQSQAFGAVLGRDARDSHAAINLVLAQPVISSQLVDNLNASIHLRALLTDLFLIDEVLKLQASPQVALDSATGS